MTAVAETGHANGGSDTSKHLHVACTRDSLVGEYEIKGLFAAPQRFLAGAVAYIVRCDAHRLGDDRSRTARGTEMWGCVALVA